MTWGVLRVGGNTYRLEHTPITIGRDPACEVTLDDPSISRQHARLHHHANRVEIENLSQTNPAYVRGNPVLGRVELVPGDVIELGNVRVEIEIAPVKPCPHCGKPLARPNAAFCPACGKPQRAVPARDTQITPSARTLIIQVAGAATPVEFALERSPITLGRAPNNDVVIDHPFVSANHARLDLIGAEYRITDLGSLNGLLLNGARVAAHTLRHNDVIRIGDAFGNSVMLTYHDTATPATIAALRLDLAQHTTLIGRDPGAALHLDAPSVSWHHARVDWDGAHHVLSDLRSTNGTFVNGARVERQTLQPNDVVQIGPFQLTYDRAGLAQFNILGNVRLDALHLTRRVPAPHGGTRVILNDVSLSIQPREFVALVGASGAGKTTLMRALSGAARAEGVVLINGADFYCDYDAYRAMLGFVPQQNIIHRGLPVISALRYAAKLRLPLDWQDAQIEQRVAQVMRMVEIEPQRDQLVRKLSGGQIKRVSIAVELLAQPALFFLDEPTSGLDPGLEKKMMYTLRQLADQGQTIILVTHATANIDQCSKVAFLANGRLVFFGTPDEARRFFQPPNAAHPADFADIYTELARVSNPQNPERTAQEWQSRFQQSALHQKYIAQPLQHAQPSARAQRIAPRRPKISRGLQSIILTRRHLELIARDPFTLFVLLAVMPLIGLLVLLIADPISLVGASANYIAQQITYLKFGDAEKMIFVVSLAATLLGLFASAYEIVREQAIYQRERMINLSILAYVFSKAGVLFGFSLLQALLFLGVLALRVELPTQGVFLPAPVEMYITLVLTTMASVGLGLFISALTRNDRLVIYIVLLVLFAQILFAGVIFELPGVARPLAWLTVSHWSIDALGSTVDMRQLQELDKIAGAPVVKATWDVNYGHTVKHLVSRWLVLGGFAATFVALTCFRQKMKDEL